MKKSTILIAGTLVLVVIGAYVYLKGKKTTTPISSLPTSTNTTTNTTSGSSSTVNSSLGLPTSSVVNSSLGLPKTSSPSSEEQKNYLEAKDLARALLLHNSNIRDNEFILLNTKYNLQWKAIMPSYIITEVLGRKINALGYKVLPNYDIEKM